MTTLPAGEVDGLGNPLLHEQTLTARGIYVDTGMVELLELLWGQGIETNISCQGGLALPYYPQGPSFAYVAFPPRDGKRFLAGCAEGSVDHLLLVRLNASAEMFVRWQHTDTEAILAAWKGLS